MYNQVALYQQLTRYCQRGKFRSNLRCIVGKGDIASLRLGNYRFYSFRLGLHVVSKDRDQGCSPVADRTSSASIALVATFSFATCHCSIIFRRTIRGTIVMYNSRKSDPRLVLRYLVPPFLGSNGPCFGIQYNQGGDTLTVKGAEFTWHYVIACNTT